MIDTLQQERTAAAPKPWRILVQFAPTAKVSARSSDATDLGDNIWIVGFYASHAEAEITAQRDADSMKALCIALGRPFPIVWWEVRRWEGA